MSVYQSGALVGAVFQDGELYPLRSEMVIVMVKHSLCYVVDIGLCALRSLLHPSPALLCFRAGPLQTTFPRLACIWLDSANGRPEERLGWGVGRNQSIAPSLSTLVSLAVSIVSPLWSQPPWDGSPQCGSAPARWRQALDSGNYFLPSATSALGKMVAGYSL